MKPLGNEKYPYWVTVVCTFGFCALVWGTVAWIISLFI